MTLKLRPASPFDTPPLMALLADHKDKFLDDFDTFDPAIVQDVINSGTSLVIDDHGYAAGVFYFNDQVDDLRATIHLLVRPEYMRQLIKQDLVSQALDFAFDELKVKKIIAEAMSSQKNALKLLRKYRFYEHKPWYKHTRHAGEIVDVIRFELRRTNWRGRNGQL